MREQIQPRGSIARYHLASRLKPDPSIFSADELQTLEDVVIHWTPHTHQEIVVAAHGEAPLIAVQSHEQIPYYLAGYRNNFGGMELDENELAAMSEDHADAGV